MNIRNKEIRISFYFLVALILISACTKRITIHTNERYKNDDQDGKKLLILPVYSDSIFFEKNDDLVKAFSASQSNLNGKIRDIFQSILNEDALNKVQHVEIVRTNINNRLYDRLYEQDNFTRESFDLFDPGKKDIHLSFAIPKSDFIKSFIKQDVDYILIIDRLELNSATRTYYDYSQQGQKSTTGKIISRANFIFYDFVNNRNVCYGYAETKSNSSYFSNLGAWKKHFRAIIKDIFKQTPFKFKGYSEDSSEHYGHKPFR